MDFPVGYSQHLLPNLLLATLSLLGFLRNFILFLLRLLGRSDFLEPVCADRPDYSSYPARPGSAPASKIREMLPVIKFADLGAGSAPESCAVCLQEFGDEDEIRRLRCCRHVFHRSCLDRWMDHDRMTCPLCRTPLVPKESLWADFCGECRPVTNFF